MCHEKNLIVNHKNDILKNGVLGQRCMNGMDVHQQLSNLRAFYIRDSNGAASLLRKIEAPKCHDLSVTVLDGIHTMPHVPQQ
jgi:hypothetical protein